MTDPAPSKPEPNQRRPRWWYSADERRGFCWAEVVGYDYKQSGSSGFTASALYVYLKSAIFHLVGSEADTVYAELKKR